MPRSSSCIAYFYAGKSQNLSQWAKELGLDYDTLARRIRKGLTFEDAVSELPARGRYALHRQKNRRTRMIWKDIFARCTKPSHPFYEYYSSRNITVCKEWKRFPTFLRDMGPTPAGCHLRRRNRKQGYNKKNCYWKFEQRGVELFGETRTLSAWCRMFDTPEGGVRRRMEQGMALEEALTKPMRPRLSPYAKFIFFLRRFSDAELNEELSRRHELREQGKCPYCLRRNHLCEAYKCHTVTALEAVAAAGGHQTSHTRQTPKRPRVCVP